MIMHIVGGTYHEYCRDPFWNELYGSGLRAAHALADKEIKIHYHTNADEDTIEILSVICNSLNVDLHINQITRTGSFLYDHPMASPTVIIPVFADDKLLVNGNDLLLFGTLENTFIVDGNKVVFDPQSPNCPEPFSKNGSKANELIYILNQDESFALVGSNDTLDIRKFFFGQEHACAVVIKKGPDGAVLLQPNLEDVEIPLYKTKKVWPIGSGDIFSAVFAYYWLIKKEALVSCAINASKATALYVDTAILPIDLNEVIVYNDPFVKSPKFNKSVYLAGPFFTMAERWLIEQFRNSLLKCGIQVFSPFHDVGLGEAKDVVDLDIEGIVSSDAVVAILNGLDSGTLFEIGYAKALNKPVLAFVENEKHEALTMLEGTDCIIETDFSTIIYKTVWELYK